MSARGPASAAARRWFAAGGWFALGLGLWTLWVAQPTAVNWLFGIVVAAVTALAARLVAALGLHSVSFRRRWLRLLLPVAPQIVVDYALIVRELCSAVSRRSRGTRGSFVEADLDTGGDTPLGRSWRAFVELTATWSPNSYVVDIDHDNGRRVSHDLVRHQPSERPA
jgi:multisubunit Na+/H+ antiporter MnhE subunit